jgi:Fe-S-cluster-containing dehydrogenase component
MDRQEIRGERRMAKVFVIDVARCCGCYNCQLACKDEHVDNNWPPYSMQQPDTGQFWLKLQENTCGTVPKVKMHYVPMLCNHCQKPACMEVCSYDAISKREDGLVIIEPEKCEGNGGCKACVSACPYNAVYFNDELRLAQKCTGCAHLLDNGYKLPRCVESCPTDAMRFGEKEDVKDLIEGSGVLKPETGCGPNVYYRNIPGKFIAGTVYDPTEKEVIIGARCLLTSGDKPVEIFTDAYGDFWFIDLTVGKYNVRIEAKGFKDIYFPDLDTAKDINLGDIPLAKLV